MTDFVSRLAVQALGGVPEVRPRTAGLFEQPPAPQLEVLAADFDASDAPPAERSPGRPAATAATPVREPPRPVSPDEAVVQRHAQPPAAPSAPPAAPPAPPAAPPAPPAAATAAATPPGPAAAPAPLAPAPPAAAEVAEAAAPADARPSGARSPRPAAASSDPQPALTAGLEDPLGLHGPAAAPWRPPPVPLAPTADGPTEAPPPLAPAGGPPRHSQAQPTVRITIGRVDVRALTPPQPAPRPAPRAERPSLVSLSDYLERGTRRQP